METAIEQRVQQDFAKKSAGYGYKEAAGELLARKRAQTNFLDFMKYVWWMPGEFFVGRHTTRMALEISEAVDAYLKGESTFLVIKVPFRHGKSDMVSRALPPYFLGRCATQEPDVICSGYGSDLVTRFSRAAKRILQSRAYKNIFPGVKLAKDKRADASWQVDYGRQGTRNRWKRSAGEVIYAGLSGGISGSGYALGTLDDYCKNVAEAESLPFRETTWNLFTNEFLARRAPVSITVVTATPRHVDGVIGRIEKHMKEDSEFPRFRTLSFPARGPAVVEGKVFPYDTPFLFPERFPERWYKEHYATLGTYAAAGLLDCDPTVRAGNMFNVSHVHIHDDDKHFPVTRYVRFWDVASSKKEVAKTDPDLTAGALVGVTIAKSTGEFVPHIWIKDIRVGQWEAPERDPIIRGTAQRDGAAVPILVEDVGGYKDAVKTLEYALRGVRIVRGVSVSNDKVIRADPMLPVFEAGHVHIIKSSTWNPIFFKHFKTFPFGDKDDIVDAVSGAYAYLTKNQLVMPFDRRILGA